MSKRKDPAAVSLGRRGGRAAAGAGLKSWRATLTPAQRSEIARRAAHALWAKRRKARWEAKKKPPIKKPPLRAT